MNLAMTPGQKTSQTALKKDLNYYKVITAAKKNLNNAGKDLKANHPDECIKNLRDTLQIIEPYSSYKIGAA